MGIGGGQFEPVILTSVFGRPDTLAISDLNSDGRMDIVTSNFNSMDIAVIFGNGDGTFQIPERYPVLGFVTSVASGDFDSDNQIDVAVVTPGLPKNNFLDAGVYIFLNIGSGNLGAWTKFEAGFFPYSIDGGDIDRDGKLDLVIANHFFGGGISVLTGLGDGTFAARQQFGDGFVPSEIPEFVIAAQLDTDNRLDIATLGRFFSITTFNNEMSVMIGDINNDCDIDLLDVQPFVMLLMNEEFQTEADINQDGSVDLLDVDPFVDLLTD